MEENLECISCRKPKAGLTCELCAEPVCKSCVVIIPTNEFDFQTELDEDLRHERYCSSCYTNTVLPAQEAYLETMMKARDIFVFFSTQKARLPVMSKELDLVKIPECIDRDEAILRMAFQSAALGHNALIETEVIYKKVRNEGYQKMIWAGQGRPATLDEIRLQRRVED